MDRPLAAIAAALRNGDLTASFLFAEAEERHVRFDECLHAYRSWDAARGREAAARADEAFEAGTDHGLLQGIPVSLKDLYGVKGFDTFAGTPRRLPAKWEQEGPVARALRRQGAVLAGKTQMVEFAFGGIGVNRHWPVPRNPWDRETHRIPGGSSSGAGVSLAEGSAVIALGSDTAGSVRIPASVTGTVGYKPSAGRWSIEGMVPLSPTFDTPGILARSAADAAIAFAAIDAMIGHGNERDTIAPADLSGLRIGLADDYFWQGCDETIGDIVRLAIEEIEAAGAKLLSAALPEAGEASRVFRAGGLAASELKSFLQAELPEWMATLDQIVAARIANCPDIGSDEFRHRRETFDRLARQANMSFDGVDVLVCPTVKVTPFALADLQDLDAYAKANMAILHNTCVVNLLGLCAVTLPVGLDKEGLPVGLQCIAPAGADGKLISMALGIEAVLGTPHQRIGRPPCLG